MIIQYHAAFIIPDTDLIIVITHPFAIVSKEYNFVVPPGNRKRNNTAEIVEDESVIHIACRHQKVICVSEAALVVHIP